MDMFSRVLLLLAAVWASSTSAGGNFTLPISGSVDLSDSGLVGSVQLTVLSKNATRVTLDTLNVSGNPGLRRIMVVGSLQVMHVKSLDLSGTAVVPTEGQLISFVAQPLKTLLSIRSVFINSTGQQPEQPLQFNEFANLLYRLRAENFVLDNWTVAGFAANFSQEDNACQSKMFDTAAVRNAGIEALVGGSISATHSIDFRWNRIALVAKVTFNSRKVNLGHNRIFRLQNVTFLPGAFCRVVITKHPEVYLNDNAVTMETLDDLVGSVATTLRGLDLSRNPLVSQTLPPSPSPPPSSRRIRIAEWLRLESIVSAEENLDDATIERRLGDVLNRFQPFESEVDLDLSSNRLTSLAGVARVLSLQTWSSRVRHLRIARSSFSHHLNLSELPTMSNGAGELQLGDLTGSQVRSISVVTPPDFLGGRSTAPVDFSLLQTAWPGRVQMTPQPIACCSVKRAVSGGGDQLFCFINQNEMAEHSDYRRQLCGTTTEPPSVLLVALCLAAIALTAAAAFTVVVVCSVRWRRRRFRNWRLRRGEKSLASADPTAARGAEHPLRPALPKVEVA